MRYRASLIVAALILFILAGMYIGHETVTVSEIENRNMTTFEMVFRPITDENSILYNANQTVADRMESAMKDQNPLRDRIMGYYWTVDARMAEWYDRVVNWFEKPAEETPGLPDGGSEAPPSETTSRDEEVTPPEGNTDGSGSESTSDSGTTSREPEPEPPVILDFGTYPGYGYARLAVFPERSYTLSKLGGSYRVNGSDWLIDAPWTSLGDESKMKASLAALERIKKSYPDLKLYGFFVSNGNNLPWFEDYMGKRFGDRFEQLAQLAPDWIRLDRLYYEDIQDYYDMHYKSDHHWSHLGVRKGYERIYEMMREDMELSPRKQPIKTWNFTQLYGVEFRGSKAGPLQSLYNGWDELIADEYDCGNRNTYVLHPKALTTKIPARLALWEEYKAGNINKGKYTTHYSTFQGRAVDQNGRQYADSEYIFLIENPDSNTGRNLLMFGDSNMRALRDVIATHFDTVVYIDYRIMATPYIDELIELYDINVMLSVVQDGNFWFDGNQGQYRFTFSPNMK